MGYAKPALERHVAPIAPRRMLLQQQPAIVQQGMLQFGLRRHLCARLKKLKTTKPTKRRAKLKKPAKQPDATQKEILKMARLVYCYFTSLDGHVAEEKGKFDWAEPDEAVLEFVNELERPIRTYLYGRRMYETMTCCARSQ